MIRITDRDKMDIEFAVKVIKEICGKRNYEEAEIKCNLLLCELEIINEVVSVEEFSELKNSIIDLIDGLKFVIQTEIRFVLFPLPDIKKEAYEIGKKYMKNFLEWIKPEDEYTPEQLMGILEEEIYRLDETRKIILSLKNKMD